ncbi:DNA-3-methyladenine glycosylase [Allofustis seminis]|uniref:DNA-3-methyladenine glycosylase n=1 Tax=Allofustis seminis TaxID=166939 RepID=UPI00035D5093|nr:DNA-3-methyladenine glycosylase [Allofustis seminis]
MHKIPLAFYEQDTLTVAHALIGKIIAHEVNGQTYYARITDCEAYPGIVDKASHTYGGRHTKRTRTLYKRAGHLYVYFVYGMHCIANIVCGPDELGGGVMLRAVEAVSARDEIFFASNRFGKAPCDLSSYQHKNLLNGPAKLAQALQISLAQDGEDLLGDTIYLIDDGFSEFEVGTTVRIGIDYAEEDALAPYRFFMKKVVVD